MEWVLINMTEKLSSKSKLINKTILIVEESEALRQTIATVCSHWGANTILSGDCKEAIGITLIRKPDLIIYHPGREKRKGYYVCRVLKNLPDTKKIPILLTVSDYWAFRDPEVKIPAFDDYINKPFGAIDLIEKVEQLMGC